MKIQSCKAKGRRLQQKVAEDIRRVFSLPEEDVRSTSMGCGGEDVQLSARARSCFPYSVECKNQERVNFWACVEQASSNCKGHVPLLITKKNGSDVYATLPWSHLLSLLETPPSQTKEGETTQGETVERQTSDACPSCEAWKTKEREILRVLSGTSPEQP